MITSHELIAISTPATLITLSGLILIPHQSMQYRSYRLLWAVIIFLLALYLPVYKSCTLVQILHGIVGDLSITTLLVLAWITSRKILYSTLNKPVIHPTFAWLIMLLGGLLYLSTLGFIEFDVYAFGYYPGWIILLSFVLTILLLLDYAGIYAWFWLVGLICFYFKLQNSNNLWDYMFDPILWLICIFGFFSNSKKPR